MMDLLADCGLLTCWYYNPNASGSPESAEMELSEKAKSCNAPAVQSSSQHPAKCIADAMRLAFD